MANDWLKKSETAFKFWRQVLISWDENPACKGKYCNLISHLKRFEKRAQKEFKYIIEKGADPVYVLDILIRLCDEKQVTKYSQPPRFSTHKASANSLSDLGDFNLVTESNFKKIDAAFPSFREAGIKVDQPFIEILRQRFEQIPEPPLPENGYMAEKAILYTEFKINAPEPPQTRRGRPGEHYFNTAMCLLSRHFERVSPRRWSGYTSIAILLSSFCPQTFEEDHSLYKHSVQQRIRYYQDRCEDYCKKYEEHFEVFKRFIHAYPIPLNPWAN